MYDIDVNATPRIKSNFARLVFFFVQNLTTVYTFVCVCIILQSVANDFLIL